MEFTCLKEDLYKGVQTVERIVATRSTLPIIGNILFEAEKGNLKMSANNLEMGIEVIVPAKVEEEGSVLVPAKTLGAVVGRFPEGNINFKVNEKRTVRIAYKQSTFNLNGLPPDEFPVLPKIKEGKTMVIDAKILSEMIKETIFAVSLSEEKHVLNGVLIELGKADVSGDTSNMRLVATDGYRLAKRGEKITPAPTTPVSVIVPARALAELSRILTTTDAELKVLIGADQIAFKYKDTYLVSRLISGQFPDYRQVIPKGSETKVVVGRDNLLEAAERAAVIASGSANIVKLEIKAGKLHIAAATPDVGSVDEVIEVEVSGSEKTAIAFNVRLITDALKNIPSDKVVLELSGPLSPGVIKPEAAGLDYIYIIMPIRTTETAV